MQGGDNGPAQTRCSGVQGIACVGLAAKPCPGVIISNSQLSVLRQNTYFGEVLCKHFLSESLCKSSLYACLRTTLATQGERVQKSGIYTPKYDVFGPEALLLSARINWMLCVAQCLLGIEAERLPDERRTLESPFLISHRQ